MKVIGCVTCTFLLICLLKLGNSEKSRTKIQEEILDDLTPDDSFKAKRPFCNAFTGCGKKRSFYDSPMDPQDFDASENIRIPFSIYKALLKAATQNMRNSIERDSKDYQLPDIPQVYFPRKMAIRKRLGVLPADLD